MPYALLSCSSVTLLYFYRSLKEINGDGEVVTKHSAYRWQQYDIIMTSLKKSVRDITRIFCFVTTMKFTTYISDLFNSFCEKVYAVAFFKVVQQ